MRAVLDTNVLARSTEHSAGPARELFLRFHAPDHVLLVSRYLLAELARVLTYPRLMALHRLTIEQIEAFLRSIELVGQMVETSQDEVPKVVATDPADDPIFLLAANGNADVLCTLDRHFHNVDVIRQATSHGFRICSDVELLAELRATDSDSGPTAE